MAQTFTFLFAPIEAVGHFNACIGIGQQLLMRGYKVVFATPNTWRGKLKPLGFDEEYFQKDGDECNEKWGDIVTKLGFAMGLLSIDRLDTLSLTVYHEFFAKVKNSDAKMRQIMRKVRPDVVLIDDTLRIPALMDQGVPWILVSSSGPLGTILSDQLPPAWSGYSVLEEDHTQWEKFARKQTEAYADLFQKYQTWVIENGGPKISFRVSPFWFEPSPFANIYMYPEEMSYDLHHSETLSTWHRFDAFVRKEHGTFEIPASLENLPGKLIYFSLGSIGCCMLKLMRKFISILAKSPHRFIFSKGILGDQLELGPNMWGTNSVAQTLVLPVVDLVITHGGNNTITESFYFGKPLLVLPLFGDQLDNGTRVQETGHGLQFQPIHVTESELLQGIETLVNDKLLKNRMNFIGQRIRANKCQSKVADLVERVAFSNSRTLTID